MKDNGMTENLEKRGRLLTTMEVLSEQLEGARERKETEYVDYLESTYCRVVDEYMKLFRAAQS